MRVAPGDRPARDEATQQALSVLRDVAGRDRATCLERAIRQVHQIRQARQARQTRQTRQAEPPERQRAPIEATAAALRAQLPV